MAVSPDGKRLAVGGGIDQGVIRILDSRDGTELRVLNGHKAIVTSLLFSPKGDMLVAASGGIETRGEIKVWDWAGGRELRVLADHVDPAMALAISADVPSGDMATARMLRVATGGFNNTLFWPVAFCLPVSFKDSMSEAA